MMIAAAHLTPGATYEDTPSDAPGFFDGGMHGRVAVIGVGRDDSVRYAGFMSVSVRDVDGTVWTRSYNPTRLIVATP